MTKTPVTGRRYRFVFYDHPDVEATYKMTAGGSDGAFIYFADRPPVRTDMPVSFECADGHEWTTVKPSLIDRLRGRRETTVVCRHCPAAPPVA
jgi:hypothetical protein